MLSGGFVVAWPQAGPRGQMCRGGKPGHVDADFGRAVLEEVAQALQLVGALLDDLIGVTGQPPDRGDRSPGNEAPPQQSTLGHLCSPHSIKRVALSSRDVFDIASVDQYHLYR